MKILYSHTFIQYNRYKSDLDYLGEFKATAYRFSISWPRIFPNCSGTPNPAGIKYYSDYIDYIISQGAEPFLTMWHWDTPQACETAYGSWISDRIIDDFVNYADVLFKNYGDRVRYWLTLNEPEANCQFGYNLGMFAPGVKAGETQHFACVHRSHIVHGSVVQHARKTYPDQAKNWKFGMPSIYAWIEPEDPTSPADVKTAQTELNAYLGWFFDPEVFGDYAPETKAHAYLKNVPKFTAAQSAIVKGTYDFIAMNYYSASAMSASGPGRDLATQPSQEPWQTVYPAGLRKLANYMYKRYDIDLILTEIGYPGVNENVSTLNDIVGGYNDAYRLKFWQEHLTNLTAAIEEDKVPVKAVLGWALLDNFEWESFWYRFGSIAVDYNNGTLTRTVKNSTYWFAQYLQQYDNPFGRVKTAPGGN
ncbi:hypothetical protein HK104_004587, partial [Borealophlyctis nickersoniae]